MRGLIAAMGAMLVGVWTVQGQEGHHKELSEEEVGSVHCATTCGAGMNEAAKTEFDAKFNRAVALLHSFQYEEARQAFFEISANDRSCAMSRWGIAMSYYHGLWKNGDTDFGRDALEIATVIAGMNPKTTPREL